MLAGEAAEKALAGEAPQLGGRAFEPLRRVELRQLLVRLVDLLELERLLVAGEVEVVLLVELGDEAVGVVAERVELGGGQVSRHRLSILGARARDQSHQRTAHSVDRHHRPGPGRCRRARRGRRFSSTSRTRRRRSRSTRRSTRTSSPTSSGPSRRSSATTGAGFTTTPTGRTGPRTAAPRSRARRC